MMKLVLYNTVDATDPLRQNSVFWEIRPPQGVQAGDYHSEDPYTWIVRPASEVFSSGGYTNYWVAGEFEWGNYTMLEPYRSMYKLLLLVFRGAVREPENPSAPRWGRQVAKDIEAWLANGFDSTGNPVCGMFRPYAQTLLEPDAREYSHVKVPCPGEPPLPRGPPPATLSSSSQAGNAGKENNQDKEDKEERRRRRREEREARERKRATVIRTDT